MEILSIASWSGRIRTEFVIKDGGKLFEYPIWPLELPGIFADFPPSGSLASGMIFEHFSSPLWVQCPAKVTKKYERSWIGKLRVNLSRCALFVGKRFFFQTESHQYLSQHRNCEWLDFSSVINPSKSDQRWDILWPSVRSVMNWRSDSLWCKIAKVAWPSIKSLEAGFSLQMDIRRWTGHCSIASACVPMKLISPSLSDLTLSW